MAELTRLALANIPLDLRITICMFLRPIDILALRKTCKTFELITRQRVVWLAVIHRVCLDNTLFLPSFPIPDMSDLELEQAAIAPHRWIELCGTSKELAPKVSRTISDVAMQPKPYLFLVPGGRYLVVAANKRLFVWDLGYVSNNKGTLIASRGVGLNRLESVQATPDGMGLIILGVSTRSNSIYEIYPQSETPLLTLIAHLDYNNVEGSPAHLLSDTLVFRDFHDDRIVFRFWDYRLNLSTCFSAYVDVEESEYKLETFPTKTAIIVFCEEGILVWAIPRLLPYSPDHFLDNNPTHLPLRFRIPYPDDIFYLNIHDWKTTSSWYFGSSEPIYFDHLRFTSKLDRFKLIVKPDLSDASLHVIDTSEFTHDFKHVIFQKSYRICENTPVSFWSNSKNGKCGVFTGLSSAHFDGDGDIKHGMVGDVSLCPASGRIVYDTGFGRIFVDDLMSDFI